MGNCEGKCLMRIGNQDQVDIKQAYNEYTTLQKNYKPSKGCRSTCSEKLDQDELLKHYILMNILTSVLPKKDMCTIPPLPEMYNPMQEWVGERSSQPLMVESYVVRYTTGEEIPIKVPKEWDMFETRELIDNYVKHIPIIIKIKDTPNMISKALNKVHSSINNYKTAQAWRSAFRMSVENLMSICNTYESHMSIEQKEKWIKIQKKYTEATKEKQFVTMGSGAKTIIVHSMDKNINIELPDDCLGKIKGLNEDCIIEEQSQAQLIMPDKPE